MNIPLRKNCSVVKKYPAFRDKFVNGSWKWIEGKRKDDYAEGLWRVHDKLYDLTEFVGKHPGGEYWLEITKGTDVTEAFETHHFSNEPSKVLAKYYVKDAADPRNYFFTYDDNGFYRTLKKRVGAKLQNIDASFSKKSELIHDLNLIGLFISAIFLTRSESDVLKGFWTLVAAQLLAWTANFSHNFVHQKDNWRMYTANLTLITWRDFRVFHVLSHHMYSNSYSDFEQSCYEPYYKWIPTQEKSWFYKIFAVLISPVLYITFFHNMWRYRIQGVLWANQKVLHWDELISVALPVVLILFGKEPMSEKLTWAHLSIIYTKWSYIFVPAQLLFGSHFFNRGHHATNLVHQNDEIKSFDFGEYQISTTVDRSESKVNSFTSLAYFGDQVLHHLFPTVDSSALPLLRDTLSQTCKEFDVDLKPQISMGKAAFEQFKQLFRSDTMRNL